MNRVLAFVLFVSVSATAGNIYEDLELMGQTLTIVRDSYVDDVDIEYLINEAIRGMVEYLDEHSTYLDTEDVRLFEEETNGRFGGIGVMMGLREGIPTVVAPIEGSPAWTAGLRPGDQVLEIGGIATLGLSLRSAVARLRGEVGTPVYVTVKRPGITGLTQLEITREEITIPTVPHSFTIDAENGKRIGYVRFSMFMHSSAKNFRTAINELITQRIAGLIIDLRGNPGGLLSEATEVADQLLPPDELICYTIGKKGQEHREYMSVEPALIGDIPLILLVDEGSASGSEIVSGALQAQNAGIVVGQRTFGKGTVQEIRFLEDGSAVKITTARWFTPDGICIDMNLGVVDSLRFPGSRLSRGIIPNVEIAAGPGDTLLLELTAGLTQSFLDSYAGTVLRGIMEFKDFSVDSNIVDEFSNWLSDESALSQSNPDSVKDIIHEISNRENAIRRYLGTEIVRRNWGDEGVARYECEIDPFIIAGIEYASEESRFEKALPLRATRDDSIHG